MSRSKGRNNDFNQKTSGSKKLGARWYIYWGSEMRHLIWYLLQASWPFDVFDARDTWTFSLFEQPDSLNFLKIDPRCYKRNLWQRMTSMGMTDYEFWS